MPGATNDGGKDSTRGVVSSKTGFAHTGSVVNNKCGDFIIHGSTVEEEKKVEASHPFSTSAAVSSFPGSRLQLCRLSAGGASRPHSDYQTKGSGAASHHYHIRTCFVLEQLCGYRRHGALPGTAMTNPTHNGPSTERPLPPFDKAGGLQRLETLLPGLGALF